MVCCKFRSPDSIRSRFWHECAHWITHRLRFRVRVQTRACTRRVQTQSFFTWPVHELVTTTEGVRIDVYRSATDLLALGSCWIIGHSPEKRKTLDLQTNEENMVNGPIILTSVLHLIMRIAQWPGLEFDWSYDKSASNWFPIGEQTSGWTTVGIYVRGTSDSRIKHGCNNSSVWAVD